MIDPRLAAALAIIERATMRTGDLEGCIAEGTRAGLGPRALLTTAYINFGFNIINRVADALGVALAADADLTRAARLLLITGYRPLSGRPFAATAFDETLPDPYEPHVAALRTAALARDAALAFDTRNALYEGTAAGRFGDYGRAVAERAWTITQRDVDGLLSDGFSEDAVFEAAICAALGAATRQLDPLLRTLQTVSAAGETAMP